MSREPAHWHVNSWEEKARENPLFAIQTQPEMAEAGAEGFDGERMASLWAKGALAYRKWLKPTFLDLHPPAPDVLVVEYGCGVGRMLWPLMAEGYRCAGIDISPTMLAHCARLFPAVESLHLVGEGGKTDLPDGAASLVFSYAVLQHIPRLSDYLAAVSEICRLMSSGALCALHLNCGDYMDGDRWETENFETYSLHRRLSDGVERRHDQGTWSGVYIGLELLRRTMEAAGVALIDNSPMRPADPKPMGRWILGYRS